MMIVHIGITGTDEVFCGSGVDGTNDAVCSLDEAGESTCDDCLRELASELVKPRRVEPALVTGNLVNVLPPLNGDQLASIRRNRWHAPPTWVRALVSEVRLAREEAEGYEHDRGYYVEQWSAAEEKLQKVRDLLDED